MSSNVFLLGSKSDTGAYYFYALRRDDEGNLFIRRDDVANDSVSINPFGLNKPIEFDGNLETYFNKLSIIKENYFVEKKVPVSTYIEEETFEVETNANITSIDPSVNRYVQAISRTIKK